MEYVEVYASRAGFFLLHDGKILWAHDVSQDQLGNPKRKV
jgi:hypothetical protein